MSMGHRTQRVAPSSRGAVDPVFTIKTSGWAGGSSGSPFTARRETCSSSRREGAVAEYRNLSLAVLANSASNPHRIFETLRLRMPLPAVRSRDGLSPRLCELLAAELRDCHRSRVPWACPKPQIRVISYLQPHGR
jgi:hypothetical protein